MFLTAYNLAHYLIARGLITQESVVAGDFILAEAGRRNRNFKVARRGLPGIFVKQIKTAEPQAEITIQREAAFYRAVSTDPRYAPLSAMIPRFLDYDASRHALTLSLAENAESLGERQVRDATVPPEIAARLGGALARVHACGAVASADTALRPSLPAQIPWPLNLDQTGYGFLSAHGPLGTQLGQAIAQAPGLPAALSALRAHWQYDSLTHGDMKWDNCLLRGEDLVIVDWELADLGDGAWDVASLLKEYVAATLLNYTAREQARARHLPEPAAVTLETTRPSLLAFWGAYSAGRGMSGAAAAAYFDRAVRYTGARLVIAVLEYSAYAQQLDGAGRLMLESARNILEHPRIAAAQLLGAPAN
ncbi:MAG: aminoglycoside phosphotransferase family protein [Acidobacteria bacterium]|nr:aminoglycoside phosphotransferase family protein [Acidobacteriota bacterium]